MKRCHLPCAAYMDMCNMYFDMSFPSGRQHAVDIQFCPCEDVLVTLLGHQLWATSPKDPTVAVHLDLMEWARILQIEAHVSTRKFVDCMELKSCSSSLSVTKRVG